MNSISDHDFERDIAKLPPDQTVLWGFRRGQRGTHTSRTIMFDELSDLLEAAPAGASRGDYAHAVMEENCLGKRTAATRKLSLQRLSELYGLNPRLLLFGALRDLWAQSRIEPTSPGTSACPGSRPVASSHGGSRASHPDTATSLPGNP